MSLSTLLNAANPTTRAGSERAQERPAAGSELGFAALFEATRMAEGQRERPRETTPTRIADNRQADPPPRAQDRQANPPLRAEDRQSNPPPGSRPRRTEDRQTRLPEQRPSQPSAQPPSAESREPSLGRRDSAEDAIAAEKLRVAKAATLLEPVVHIKVPIENIDAPLPEELELNPLAPDSLPLPDEMPVDALDGAQPAPTAPIAPAPPLPPAESRPRGELGNGLPAEKILTAKQEAQLMAIAESPAGVQAQADLASENPGGHAASLLRSVSPSTTPVESPRLAGTASIAGLVGQPHVPGSPGGMSISSPASSTLSHGIHQPGFADELSTQVRVWTQQGVQQAELRLNPAEMGPIQVRIQLDGGQAQVLFGAEQAQTREALQNALPQLARALAQEGLQWAGGGVQAQLQQGQAQQQAPQSSGIPESMRGLARGGNDGLAEQPPTGGTRQVGLLDLYA